MDPELRAKDAAAFANTLAMAAGTQLHLVRVLETARSWWPLGDLLDPSEVAARLADVAQDMAGDVPAGAQLHVRGGHPVKELTSFCREEQIDLLILGRHYEGRHDPLVGGTAYRVLKTAACPVLMHRLATTSLPRRLLVALDLSESSIAALKLAVRWARLFQGTVHVLYVFETPDVGDAQRLGAPLAEKVEATRQEEFRHVDTLLRETDWQGVAHTVQKLEGDPGVLILKAADRKEANLVFMGTRGRTNLEGLPLGHVAAYVGRRNPRTVLVPSRSV
jgi:nucleotide-binding universal stress UspA family protein